MAAFVRAFCLIFFVAACSQGEQGSIVPTPSVSVNASPPLSGAQTNSSAVPSESNESKSSYIIESEAQAATFLIRSGFGGTMEEVRELVDQNASDWIKTQIETIPTEYLSRINEIEGSRTTTLGAAPYSSIFIEAGIRGEDQLRQRMVFALSQILVVSDQGSGKHSSMGYYVDILNRHAFGNYRELLEEVTYSPAMAEYLTYLGNEKGNQLTGRMPDENFARELLQLFTIGLVELNINGTPVLDERGKAVETYTNDDIVGLARVFTGLHLKGSDFKKGRHDSDAYQKPLEVFDDKHSQLSKSFLNTTIAPGTNTEKSIDLALDHIFEHPNVAPFISRQLIQRFTSSHPSPDYVERVARTFEIGKFTTTDGAVFGSGERGDLEATIAAILLDKSVGVGGKDSGKIREPILKFIHWARVFKVRNLDFSNERRLHDTSNSSDSIGQHPFRSSSVFNFYRPGYISPGGLTGQAGLTAPEFQLINEGSSVGFINFMYDFAIDRTPVNNPNANSFSPSYDEEFALIHDTAALLDRLDLLLTGRTLSAETRNSVMNAMSEMPVSDTTPERDHKDMLAIAITMIAASPAFAITI